MNLFDAYAVLAGNGAADGNRKFENFKPKLFGAHHGTRIVAVEHDQRMKVAVAGMKHVGAAQTIFRFHCYDRFQYFAEALAWNRSIHAVVIGGDPADRGKRSLAARPEAVAFSV